MLVMQKYKRRGKRIMKEGEKFSSAEIPFELSMNFQLCLVIYKVLIDIQNKMKPRKILGFFCFLSECYKLDFDSSGFI